MDLSSPSSSSLRADCSNTLVQSFFVQSVIVNVSFCLVFVYSPSLFRCIGKSCALCLWPFVYSGSYSKLCKLFLLQEPISYRGDKTHRERINCRTICWTHVRGMYNSRFLSTVKYSAYCGFIELKHTDQVNREGHNHEAQPFWGTG